jgi:hypothetical protein
MALTPSRPQLKGTLQRRQAFFPALHCRLSTVDCRLTCGWRLAPEKRRLAVGGWRLAPEKKRRPATGGWRLAPEKRRPATGGWREDPYLFLLILPL